MNYLVIRYLAYLIKNLKELIKLKKRRSCKLHNKWLCLFVLFEVSVLKAYLDHIWITSLTLSSFIFFFFLKSSGICRRFGLIYREGYNIIRKKLIKTRYAKTFLQTFLLLFLVQKNFNQNFVQIYIVQKS